MTATKVYDARVDAAPGERAVIAAVTTDVIDRDGEIVLPGGIDLEAFRKNPVVLFAHRRDEPPVGRCAWIKPAEDGRGLLARTVFAKTARGQECFELYQEGVLQAFSIGFRILEIGPPVPKEIMARPEMAACRAVIRSCELLEYSAVPVPANPEALALAVSKGIVPPDWMVPGTRRALPRSELETSILRACANLDPAAYLDPALVRLSDLSRGRV